MRDQKPPHKPGPNGVYDVVIVGAGFSGLCCLHQLNVAGFSTILVERAGDVGGTWYWNRYPGARCDVESLEYAFTFSDTVQKEWTWTEKYASQPEILEYLRFVSERLNLRPQILLNRQVRQATYDRSGQTWTVTAGEELLCGRFLVMATGALSSAKLPSIPGLKDFAGHLLQTSRWSQEATSFSGKRVGIIGTGSSGVQAIPVIAESARQLTVFQRTPCFSVPARNAPLPTAELEQFRSRYLELREQARSSPAGTLYAPPIGAAVQMSETEVSSEFAKRWQTGGPTILNSFSDLLIDKAANELVASFVRAQISDVVKDPLVAQKLMPRTYAIGAKRICVDTNYYATFNRDNVELVDIASDPICGFTQTSLRTASREFELDYLILATGFDALTGALLDIDIRTSDGSALREQWADGPASYLGLQIAGFPNLFVITGPGSPSVLSNMIVSIEHDVEWIIDCLEWLRTNNRGTIEASEQAQEAWTTHVAETAQLTLHSQAASWYTGANVPGKPRVFLPYVGGVDQYQKRCREVAMAGYAGFRVEEAHLPWTLE